MEMDEFSCWCFIEVKQKKRHNGKFQLKKKLVKILDMVMWELKDGP
jgi:hypothetical protein